MLELAVVGDFVCVPRQAVCETLVIDLVASQGYACARRCARMGRVIGRKFGGVEEFDDLKGAGEDVGLNHLDFDLVGDGFLAGRSPLLIDLL